MAGRALTSALMEASSKRSRPENEGRADFLERITHLHLQEKRLTDVEKLAQCRLLEVVYLYNNQITSITPRALSLCGSTLTQLYLQNNDLNTLVGLESLTSLKILHVGGNRLQVIDCLHNMRQLVELNISRQRPDPEDEDEEAGGGDGKGDSDAGDSALVGAPGEIIFAKETAETLAVTLRNIDVSGNHISSLRSVAQIASLHELHAQGNDVADFSEVQNACEQLSVLTTLDLRDNPVAKDRHFRKHTVPLGPVLHVLNGEEIPGSEKEFLRRLQARSTKNKR
jgi:protein phosphatase 1 regulatory subunit 42